VLLCVDVCCRVLQGVAVYRSVLQYVAIYCSEDSYLDDFVTFYIEIRCSVLQRDAAYCSVLQRDAAEVGYSPPKQERRIFAGSLRESGTSADF